MSLEHTPLEPNQLSAEAKKALGSGPARMMAARGMAPIADPIDLVTVLYQLVVDGEPEVRKAASGSAREVPDRVLGAALADGRLDARILDYFARKVQGKPELVEKIVLNQATADETIATLAVSGGTRLVDLIATNEQRLLRHPEIIGGMYMNPEARMSTVDRAVELAVRNRIRVPGIAAWDEICEALLESGKKGAEEPPPQADEEFDRLLDEGRGDGDPDARPDETSRDWSHMSVPMKIRMAVIGGTFWRAVAIRDPKLIVAMSAVKSPAVKENEVHKWATNHSLPGKVIEEIARRRDWTQNYAIKVALVNNPKTPVAEAMKFVPHLREREVKALARSRGVPAPVVQQARRLLAQRAGGGGRGGRPGQRGRGR